MMKTISSLLLSITVAASTSFASQDDSVDGRDRTFYVSHDPATLKPGTVNFSKKAHQYNIDSKDFNFTTEEFRSLLEDSKSVSGILFSSSVAMKGTYPVSSAKQVDPDRVVYHPLHGELPYSELVKRLK